MDGAALLLLVSGVGVAFGWQPMPDGSPRYEYVVQIEPELAATLADGKTIPIVSEVPDEIQPVGRIRVVVGHGDLPRQRLVTRLKPIADAPADDASSTAASPKPAIELAQYNQSAGPPYGTPQAAAQRYSEAAPTNQPGESTTRPQGTTAWNNDADAAGAESPVTPGSPPTSQQLFGNPSPSGTTAWNNDAASQAAGALAAPLTKAAEEIERAAQPIRQRVSQLDGSVRAAADEFGSRTRKLADELGRPFSQQSGTNAPQGSQAVGDNAQSTAGATWNGNASTSRANASTTRADSDRAGTAWNEDAQSGAAATFSSPQQPRYGQTSAPAQQAPSGVAANGTQWNGSAQPNASPPSSAANPWNGAAASSTAAPVNDSWAGVPDPRRNGSTSAAADSGAPEILDLASRPKPYAGAGSASQVIEPQPPELRGPLDGFPATSVGNNAVAPNPGLAAGPRKSGVAIAKGMLSEPPGRPLDGTDAGSSLASNGMTGAGPTGQSPFASASPWSNPATNPATKTVPAATASDTADKTAAAPARRDNAALVIAAWVLLSGSVAGNLYLFWSYLDIRQKYRFLVRKTARAVGNRFSAA